MPRISDLPPTKNELKKAVPDLLYTASQAASFGYLKLIEREHFLILKAKIPDVDRFLNNVFLELSLLFICKTTEFFKCPDRNDANDTLFAYRYLPEWKGSWVVGEHLYSEMHKRLGHITVMEARHGKLDWPLEKMTFSALDYWKAFFYDLRTSPIYEDSPPEAELREYQATLEVIARGCRRAFSTS